MVVAVVTGCGSAPAPRAAAVPETRFPMPPGPRVTAPPAADVVIDPSVVLSGVVAPDSERVARRLLEVVNRTTPLEIVLGGIDGGVVFTDTVIAARAVPLLDGATYSVMDVRNADPDACGKRYAKLPRGNCYLVGFAVRSPDGKLGSKLNAALVRLSDGFWRISADSYCALIKPLHISCPVQPVL